MASRRSRTPLALTSLPTKRSSITFPDDGSDSVRLRWTISVLFGGRCSTVIDSDPKPMSTKWSRVYSLSVAILDEMEVVSFSDRLVAGEFDDWVVRQFWRRRVVVDHQRWTLDQEEGVEQLVPHPILEDVDVGAVEGLVPHEGPDVWGDPYVAVLVVASLGEARDVHRDTAVA